MQKLLTIAVPCFNVEWCLEKCLLSLIDQQTLDRLQVLIVNDGSSDGTTEIAHEFIRKHPETFSLIDKENGGHGSAINAAIGVAGGKYFKVVDADDWVITENLIRFLDILESAEADMILTHFHTVDMKTGKKQEFTTRDIVLDKVYTIDSFTQLPGDIYACAVFHGITWRTEVYRKSGTVLSEKIFYEDQEYATLPILKAHTILPLDLFLYQYLVGNSNQSVADHNQVKRLPHVEQVVNKIYVCYQDSAALNDGIRRYVARKATDMLVNYYIIALIKNPDKGQGRRECQRLRRDLSALASELVAMTDKKYWMILALSWVRFNGRMLELIKRPAMYEILRKVFKRN